MNTVTLREPQPVHEVDFHGATIVIATMMDEFWLASDRGGNVYFYEYEPTIMDDRFLPSAGEASWDYVADVDLCGIDWRETAKRYRV